MRKPIKAILALVLCLALLPTAALASPGDAVIARRDEGTYSDYIQHVTSIGDTLYLLGSEAIYTWKPGEPDVTKYEIPNGEYSEETNSYTYVYDIFVWNDEIYLLEQETVYSQDEDEDSSETINYSHVSLPQGDGDCVIERVGQLDWESLMEYYDDYSYARQPEQSVVIGDTLYVKVYGDNGYEIYGVPLDGGYAKQIEDIQNAYLITKYTNDRLLIEEIVYEGDGYTVTLEVYDPASGSIDLLFAQAGEQYSPYDGLVTDHETGLLYYFGKGTLNSIDPETLEVTVVNDFPTGSYMSAGTSCLLDGGFYAAVTYDATVVRNTDPSLRAEKTLTVFNGAYVDIINKTYFNYSNTHGDVSVAIVTADYGARQSIVEAMMNRSSQYDIYVIDGTESDYNAVFTRGYMAELSSSEIISSFLDEMYPSLAEQLKYNGEIVAVPMTVSGYTLGMNKQAMEKLGLTEADIPTNWPALLDWLSGMADEMETAGVKLAYDWTTQSDFRNQMFSFIFMDYQKYLNWSGQEQGYNTEILYNMLKKLEDIDLDAFGLPKEIDWENMDGGWSEDGDPILFETYVGCTIDQSYVYSTYCPLLLSVSPDAPVLLQLSSVFAFVNPYSEHKEEAVSFLESAVDALSYSVKANLVPAMNEAARPANYESDMEEIREVYEHYLEEAANASDEDKQMFEEIVQGYEQYLKYMEEDQWDVSPKAIEWYRAHDDNILFDKYHPLYSGDASSEIYDLLQQYMDGALPLEQLLRSLDQKVQMMLLEGN